MANETDKQEHEHCVSGSELSGFVIQRHELDKLEAIRLELHEIATHNPQIEQYMLTITSKLWPIIHKKRKAV